MSPLEEKVNYQVFSEEEKPSLATRLAFNEEVIKIMRAAAEKYERKQTENKVKDKQRKIYRNEKQLEQKLRKQKEQYEMEHTPTGTNAKIEQVLQGLQQKADEQNKIKHIGLVNGIYPFGNKGATIQKIANYLCKNSDVLFENGTNETILTKVFEKTAPKFNLYEEKFHFQRHLSSERKLKLTLYNDHKEFHITVINNNKEKTDKYAIANIFLELGLRFP